MNDYYILVVLFILIVVVYLIQLDSLDFPTKLFVIFIIIGAFIMYVKTEKFKYRRVNNDATLVDADDEHSRYGNILSSWDKDTLKQLNPTDLYLEKSKEIDNSDVVERVLLKGDTHHMPLSPEGGFTATNTPYTNPYFLHQKDDRYSFGLPGEHSYPTNDSNVSLDEALAIKQNHTGTLNKRALDGMVRNTTKENFKRYYINELDENASREWWANDATEMEVDFRPYDFS